MATVPDPMTAPSVRWGILGTGGAAHAFAAALRSGTRSILSAVGSRSFESAEVFAHDLGIESAHSSYQELVNDPQVDVVYVATPHSEHREHALLAIQAGKHVLVEKSFARNIAEATEVFEAAKAAGVFVMEGMWTRFLPHVIGLHDVIARGDIGEIVNITADCGQYIFYDPSHRHYNPDLAGGALLEFGVYPVAFAHDFLGVPDAITAVGALTPNGVDGQVSVVLSYGEQAQAVLSTTLWSTTPAIAAISGTGGRIEVTGPFYTSDATYSVHPMTARPFAFSATYQRGMRYEIAEVARCIADGRTESERMSHQATLDVIATMDEIRRQVGVVYPGEPG
jgi:predicted dehydrogenase